MTREEDIRRLLLNLLRTGILRIRAFASQEDASRCFDEADHIHNLPDMIRNPRLELLSNYFDVERPGFIAHSPSTDAFEADWLRLGELVDEMRVETTKIAGL
jgi:hypothetical protein